MFRSYKKTCIGKIVDIIDFYCSTIYDMLWGNQIYMWVYKKPWSWHKTMAYQLAQYLPPSPHAIKYAILRPLKLNPMQKEIKRLEMKLFGKVI